jgi:hypothetical protein
MKNKLLSFTKGIIYANPIPAAIVGALLVLVLVYFGGSIKQKIQDYWTDHKVEQLDEKSNDHQQKANQEIRAAIKASGSVAAEDERRERDIKPAIEKAARTREVARAATRKAQHDYETSQTGSIADADLLDLRERNCREFSELYPADDLARCTQ